MTTPSELVEAARAATAEIRILERKDQLGVRGERAHARHSDTLFHTTAELRRSGHGPLADAVLEEDEVLQSIEAGKELGVESPELKAKLSDIRRVFRSAK